MAVLVESRRALPDIARIFMSLTAIDWPWLSTQKAVVPRVFSHRQAALERFELRD
jgi:hypothetical protein